MKEIVDWLITVEEIAGDIYYGASKQFADDHKLSAFLSHMAEDEGWHYHVMGSASEYLRKEQEIISEIVVDSSVKERIESPFSECYEMLSYGTLTKETIIDCLIDTEYSEWNDIFIYVVNTLKERSREFKYVASKMQNHIQKISAFVDSLPDSGKYTDKINDIPEVWKRSFLIVEDFEPIRIMLKTLLENEGKVDMVENGNDALKKIAESYYDIVISDIEMPLMNGIEFCKEASKIDPDIIKRIIFCSSAHKDEYMKYITENSIRFLRKPMNITDIRRHVRELISEKSQ